MLSRIIDRLARSKTNGTPGARGTTQGGKSPRNTLNQTIAVGFCAARATGADFIETSLSG